MAHEYSDFYDGANLNYTAFPMGGIGAGMICLDGTGSLSHVSLRHRPQIFNEPYIFAAVCVKSPAGKITRVLAGPTPDWKIFFPWGSGLDSAGNGGQFNKTYGFPRFRHAAFDAHFPFGTVSLQDPTVPITANITGWSPFIPGNSNDSSLPVAGLEYEFHNPTDQTCELVFSFHAKAQFIWAESGGCHISRLPHGFMINQPGSTTRPFDEASFAIACDNPQTTVDAAWFRGGWFDAQTLAWQHIENGDIVDREAHPAKQSSSGGSLYTPLNLAPGETKRIKLRINWYVPYSNIRWEGCCPVSNDQPFDPEQHYRPWYAAEFQSEEKLRKYWHAQYDRLCIESKQFSDCLQKSNMPPAMLEAITANLTILKSPTVLRQHDGRIWAYEGCCDSGGCCEGSCTHVWNYAQALPHLFPELERTLRETEFLVSQDDRGHQAFRTALPIGPQNENWRKAEAAADGQLGGIMKLYREWRISGDTEWLRKLWPAARQSLDYCIDTWDPEQRGVLMEPHHNTYDIEFWGSDGMCCSFYLGALKAAILMAPACNDESARYEALYEQGRRFVETELWNGEYFIQKVQTEGLRAPRPSEYTSMVNFGISPEAKSLIETEGPRYQYGNGCLSDGVLGCWLALMCGLPDILDPAKVHSHLNSVFKYNYRVNLWEHANPQRPGFALDRDGGLLLCSWPQGNALTLPFPYSNEVWTGFEYQVASHLLAFGDHDKALRIVSTARDRHDGTRRNPFNEYECGSWYARAMSSYGLLQSWSGAHYDAVEQILYVRKPGNVDDATTFICTASGYGLAGYRNGQPFLDVHHGVIPLSDIRVQP